MTNLAKSRVPDVCGTVASCLFCLALACLGGRSSVQAHEIGTTRVSAVLAGGKTYEVEVVTDAASLVEKLDALAGENALLSTQSPQDLGKRLCELDEVFRRRVSVLFDGSATHPTITYSVSPAVDAMSPVKATIRLIGEIPPAARDFSWVYSWTFASYAFTVTSGDVPSTEWLDGGQPSRPIPLTVTSPPSHAAATTLRYLVLGFTHVVPRGLDHMLFVLGIFLLSRRLRALLWQVSAFTVAHSITLGLSSYGLVAVPAAFVEPLIAVSIGYVAIENLVQTELKSWRIALVFAFGLLHGLGFAGALKELGLPRSEFLTALVMFNVGVEAGQLAVIAAAFLLVGWSCGRSEWYRQRVVVPASLLIACTAAYWTVERMVVSR
jgi:hypothetical protein